MLLHFILTSVVSEKKSAIFLLLVHLYVVCLFSLTSKFYYVHWFLSNLIIMCLGVVFFTFLVLEVCWASWICGLLGAIKLGNFQGFIYSRSFSPSLSAVLWTLHFTCIWLLEIFPLLPKVLLIFFSFFPSLCFNLGYFYFCVLKFGNLFLLQCLICIYFHPVCFTFLIL